MCWRLLRLYLGTGCDVETGCDGGSLSNYVKDGCCLILIFGGLPRFLVTLTAPVSGSLLLPVATSLLATTSKTF